MEVDRALLLLLILIVTSQFISVAVAQPAVELYYDDNECDWNYLLVEGKEPVAYAVEFSPSSIPWILTAVRLYYSPCDSRREVLRIEIWDQGRRKYFTHAINISHYTAKSGWILVDMPDLLINFTPFYVVVWLEKWGCVASTIPGIGYDSDKPQGRSYRAGVIGGNVLRHKLGTNVMIRVIGTTPEAYAGEPLTPTVLGNIREELSYVARRVDSLENGVSEIRGSIASVTSRLENLERGVESLGGRLKSMEDVGRQLSELSSMLRLLTLASAFLCLLALASLAAAVRASRRASKLEGQVRLLEARLKGVEAPAPRPPSTQAMEAKRAAEAKPQPALSWLIVIDGSNVAYAARDSAGRPRAKNIMLAISWAEERGYTPLVVVDASLKHHIDNPYMLDYLRARGILYEAPARTSADAFIISIAEKHGALILSNDTFKEYLGEKPWIEKRRLAFMIVGDEIYVVPPGEREQKEGEGRPQSS